MNGHDVRTVSDVAQARKQAIFEAARSALVRRRRRRAAVRAGSAACVLTLLIAGAAYVTTLAGRSGHPAPAPAPTPIAAETAAVRVMRITTDPDIITRTRVMADSPRLVQRIDDAELLAVLQATGDRYGIIRTGAGVAVVCQTCRTPDGALKGWGAGLSEPQTGASPEEPGPVRRGRPL